MTQAVGSIRLFPAPWYCYLLLFNPLIFSYTFWRKRLFCGRALFLMCNETLEQVRKVPLKWRWGHSVAVFVLVCSGGVAVPVDRTNKPHWHHHPFLQKKKKIKTNKPYSARRTWYVHDGFSGRGLFLVGVNDRHLICGQHRGLQSSELQRSFKAFQRFQLCLRLHVMLHSKPKLQLWLVFTWPLERSVTQSPYGVEESKPQDLSRRFWSRRAACGPYAAH